MRAFATHDFLPGPGHDVQFAVIEIHREYRRSRVTNVRPARSSGIQSSWVPGRGGSIVGENDVVFKIDSLQIG